MTAPLPPSVPLPWWRLLREIRNYHTAPELFHDLAGPVARVQLGPASLVPAVIVTTSPQGAHDVLTAAPAAVDKQTGIVLQLRKVVGDFLFDLPHDEWLPRRKALQPLFTKEHIKCYAGHMADAADAAIAEWDDSTVDLDAAMRRLTLTVLGRSVLGMDLGDRADQIGAALLCVARYSADRGMRPVRAPRWLPTPARRRVRRAVELRHSLTDEAITACRADPEHKAPLVRQLLATVDPDTGAPLTPKAVGAELGQFLLAGHDTTSTTLTYALWQLGRHPDLQDRVAAEVRARGDRPLGVDDVAHLGFTVQVLHEALRLCPPGAAVGRHARVDVVVDGFRAPAGSLIIVGIRAIHRDPALWSDAASFDPDRFAPGRPKTDRWQFLPFGGGPRSCIGDHFAMLEATLGLATIVRAVEITSLDAEFPLAVPFTMVAGGPIRARVRARHSASTPPTAPDKPRSRIPDR
ncbi:MAG TPA: cytochrome P450 [Aldersonia sp.]